MIEFNVKEASVVYRWTFNKMLLFLPLSITPEFALLCRELRQFGMHPTGVAISMPTALLDDVVMNIALLKEQANLKLTYSYFELLITNIYSDDSEFNDYALIQELPAKIITSVFSVLEKIDSEVIQGQARISCGAHIDLLDTDAKSFMKRHFKIDDASDKFIPDGFAYNINLTNNILHKHRSIISSSLKYNAAIFAEFMAQSFEVNDPDNLIEQFIKDCKEVIALFGLKHTSSK